MSEYGLTVPVLSVSARIGVVTKDGAALLIQAVLNREPLTEAHARALERCTGISARFWLALGAQLPGWPGGRADRCQRGDPVTGYVYRGAKREGCPDLEAVNKAIMDARDDTDARGPNPGPPLEGTCRRNHPRTLANVRVTLAGKIRCRPCDRISQQDRRKGTTPCSTSPPTSCASAADASPGTGGSPAGASGSA